MDLIVRSSAGSELQHTHDWQQHMRLDMQDTIRGGQRPTLASSLAINRPGRAGVTCAAHVNTSHAPLAGRCQPNCTALGQRAQSSIDLV